MATLSKVVNKTTKEVLGTEKLQGTIESMQLDLANEGRELIGKAIKPVWNQFLAALKRQNEANANKIVLKGDYQLIAEKFKNVSFVGMTMQEIEHQIYMSHEKERGIANDNQREIIKEHSKLEARVVDGRLASIADFLRSKGIEVTLSEDLEQAGKTAIAFYTLLDKVGKNNDDVTKTRNPYVYQKNVLLSPEQWTKVVEDEKKKKEKMTA